MTTKFQLPNPKLLTGIALCVVFTLSVCLAAPCLADTTDPKTQSLAFDTVTNQLILTETGETLITDPAKQPSALAVWLGTYNPTLGMCNASIFTTIFGGAFVAFFIAICWGKLVEIYGAAGGLFGGGVIVGTFWVINHKLPGIGIAPGGIPHDAGFGIYQYGLIVQAFHGTGPWVDMGLAVCVGLFTMSFLERLRAKKLDPTLPGGAALLSESFPRALSVILGGIAGGAIVGLIGFTGARL